MLPLVILPFTLVLVAIGIGKNALAAVLAILPFTANPTTHDRGDVPNLDVFQRAASVKGTFSNRSHTAGITAYGSSELR